MIGDLTLLETLFGLAAVVSSGLLGWATFRSEKNTRKAKASADAAANSQATVQFVQGEMRQMYLDTKADLERVEVELDSVKTELKDERTKSSYLTIYVSTLIEAMRRSGLEVPEPPEELKQAWKI